MGKRVNTTVKERKALLKELGYTEDEMQRTLEQIKEKQQEEEAKKEAGTEITADVIYKIVNYMAHHCISCNIDKLTQSEIIEMHEYLKEHVGDIK